MALDCWWMSESSVVKFLRCPIDPSDCHPNKRRIRCQVWHKYEILLMKLQRQYAQNRNCQFRLVKTHSMRYRALIGPKLPVPNKKLNHHQEQHRHGNTLKKDRLPFVLIPKNLSGLECSGLKQHHYPVGRCFLLGPSMTHHHYRE